MVVNAAIAGGGRQRPVEIGQRLVVVTEPAVGLGTF